MAAVSVTFDGTRVNDADATTNWTGATSETEFVYQGNASNSVQVKTTEAGEYYYNSGVSHDYSTSPSKTWIAKAWVTNYGALDGNGLILEIGTGARSAYYRYFIYSASTYPISGGWLLIPIDPSISGYRSATTGSPTLSTINFYGIRADFSLTARTQNVAMDAIDFIPNGTGLTLVGGDGADADGTFQSFITYDEGTSGNRYGIVSTKEGILYVLGVLTIGTATATVFTDSNQTLVFPAGRFATGFCGIDVNLSSATTVVTLNAITMVGRGSASYLGSSEDTRPDIGVTNTSGDLIMDACNVINFRNIVLTSGCTITDTTFNRCVSLTQSSASLSNCAFDSSPVATNAAFLTCNNPSLISNSTFISGGTGHAIELTTACAGNSYNFDANLFSGYATDAGTAGNRAIYNNSGGEVTLNILNAGDIPSVRNGAGASTTITANVTATITVQDESANPIVGAQVAVFKSSDNSVLIASTPTNASGQVTGSIAQNTGAIYIRVRQSTNTATFATTAGVNGSTEVITTDVAHSFVDGEAVTYSKNGGAAAVGLTDGTTYYVNSLSSTTLSLYTSAANAISDTSRVNLTANGAETHQLDPVRYYPNSTVGNIGTSAFNVTITLIVDTTVSG